MPDVLVITIAVVGLFSTCCGLLLSLRTIKKTSPSEALKAWQQTIDDKLDADNRRLKHLEEDNQNAKEVDRLMIRSIRGVIQHLVSNNNNMAGLNILIKDIDDHLLAK